MMICTPDLYFLYCDKMRPDAAILYCDSLCTVMKCMRPAAASVQNSKFEKKMPKYLCRAHSSRQNLPKSSPKATRAADSSH